MINMNKTIKNILSFKSPVFEYLILQNWFSKDIEWLKNNLFVFHAFITTNAEFKESCVQIL